MVANKSIYNVNAQKKNVTKHEDNKLNVEKSSKVRMSHLEKKKS
jgi:hypothetical protein